MPDLPGGGEPRGVRREKREGEPGVALVFGKVEADPADGPEPGRAFGEEPLEPAFGTADLFAHPHVELAPDALEGLG